MTEYALTQDFEAEAIRLIQEAFTDLGESATVHTRIPKDANGNLPDTFVRLWGANYVRDTLISTRCTITVEGWAQTEVAAQKLMNLATAVLEASELTIFDATKVGGLGNNPHPDFPNLFRYSALVQCRMRDQILRP